ncbi:MAG: aldehyde dehydrogenase family protein, partial [Vulcanimicrobiaceae bacterium]
MATTAVRAIGPFRNETIRDFKDPADRASLEAALERARGRLGTRYPLVIDGKKIETAATLRSINPAHPEQVVGEVASATLEQANEAVEIAFRRFADWKQTSAQERTEILFRAAELVRKRRDDFNALMILEVGKSWPEADADTAEAIDFMEFSAREALRYERPPPLVPISGEENVLRYIPLGVGIVVPPWNFAFAIMAGMTAAALVTGNTVVLKPSSDAAVIAAVFVDLLHEVGLPPGVVNYVPGSGRTIGDALVAHPKTRFIAFTGSKEVGLHINELAAKTQPGQKWIKRVIAEMGGKDSIVVAADADLERAVEGVAVSAFGFQGQKCSACSRAIVEAPVYDEFVERLRKRVASISTGDPAKADTYMGPVINEGAQKSILGYIEAGKREGRLVAGGEALASDGGYYVAPTVIADVAP